MAPGNVLTKPGHQLTLSLGIILILGGQDEEDAAYAAEPGGRRRSGRLTALQQQQGLTGREAALQLADQEGQDIDAEVWLPLPACRALVEVCEQSTGVEILMACSWPQAHCKGVL